MADFGSSVGVGSGLGLQPLLKQYGVSRRVHEALPPSIYKVTERGRTIGANPAPLLYASDSTVYVRKFRMRGKDALGNYKTWIVPNQADETGGLYTGTNKPIDVNTITVATSWVEIVPYIAPVLTLPKQEYLSVRVEAGKRMFTGADGYTGPTTTDGALIGTVADVGANYFQRINSGNINYRATGMQGARSALEFTGTAGLSASAPSVFGSNVTQPRTYAISFQLTTAMTPGIEKMLAGFGDVPVWLLKSDGSNISNSVNFRRSSGISYGFGGTAGAILDLNRHLLVWRYNGSGNSTIGNYDAWWDKVKQTLVAGYTINSTYLGFGTNSSYPCPMFLQYGFIWETWLDDTEIAQVHTYMG